MPSTIPSMPAIDQNVFGDWTVEQRGVYQALPYWLAKIQVDMKTTFPTFSRLTKKRRWKQNQGPTFRGVRTNPSPHIRQFAMPRPITMAPLTDVMNIRETTVEAQVRWHDFESPMFEWYNSFNDFMDHIEDNGRDIAEKIERYNEVFIRGCMFHMSPFVFLAQQDGTVKLQDAPFWSGSGEFDATNHGKTAAFLSDNSVKPTGPLSFTTIEHALTIAENDLRIPFFSGSDLPKEDQPLDGKFLLSMDSEAWNGLVYDKHLLANRPLNMDIVGNGYRGSFFGRATTRLEDLPIRYTGAGVFKEPELRADNAAYNAYETLPNSEYTDPAVSQFGVAWFMGKNGYETIETGPPPSLFTGDSFPNSPKMDWSGVPRLTKNFLIEGLDAAGNVKYQANTYGKYIKFIAEQTFGILATQRRNAIPILYKRVRGVR